jgi:ATP-binding cassette subfamily C protein
LVALSAIDALALFLLGTAFQFSSQSESQGVLVNATSPKLILPVVLFASRSVLSVVVTWISSQQLAREQAAVGTENFKLLLNPNMSVEGISESHETRFFNSVDRGPEILTMMMMNAAVMLGEVVSIVIILSVFLFLDPFTAAIALLYFSSVVLIQHKVLSRRSAFQGQRVQQARNKVYQSLVDASRLNSVFSFESKMSITTSLTRSLAGLTRAGALSQVYASIPRYLLELTFVVGLGVIGLASLAVSGPTDALASLVLFAGVSFRLLPIVNRVQGLALTMIAHTSLAALALLDSTEKRRESSPVTDDSNVMCRLSNVGFSYSKTKAIPVLSDITLKIERGRQYAIVGPSGAGKSTLASILLGVERPTQGFVQRNSVFRSAFVPQDTHLAFIPLAENVSLLWDRSRIDFDRTEKVLRLAGLASFVDRISDTTPLSNDDVSGGEKQRIGLARALYSGADFIVLDEVTSSLDAVTESGIVDTLYSFRGDITTVIIAHRLSTVQHADEVFYLEAGKLLGTGTFVALAAQLPKLRRQIELGQIQLFN